MASPYMTGRPEVVLDSPEEVVRFQYNPFNPDIVAAGCLNGQVALWDCSPDEVQDPLSQIC